MIYSQFVTQSSVLLEVRQRNTIACLEIGAFIILLNVWF